MSPLPTLEFMTYGEYLQTEHWQETRAAALKRAGGRCALCPRENAPLQVHHRTYERLGEELQEDLVVLCDECHEALEVGHELLQGRASDNGQFLSAEDPH